MAQHLTRVLASALALAGAAPAGARERVDETIVIRLRHPHAFCAGFCPDFEMKVGSDGWVVSHSNPDHSDAEVHRYQVTMRQLGNFRRILRSVRPRGDRRLDRTCRPSILPDGTTDSFHDPRPDDVEVRWIGTRSEARLTSCAYTNLPSRRAIERAVRALGAELLFGSREGSVYRAK